MTDFASSSPEELPPATADQPKGKEEPGPDAPPLHAGTLLHPAAWPGVRLSYHYDGPALLLLLHFDLSRVECDAALPDAAPVPRYLTALATCGAAVIDLNDPRVSASVTQSVLPAHGGALGDSDAIKAALLAFAIEASGQLAGLVRPAQPFTHVLPIAIKPAELAARADDMFAIAAQLIMSRPEELADPGAPGATPQTVSVAMSIAPDAAPELFAGRFAASFGGYDGADGGVRVAWDALAGAAATPHLRAIRLGGSKGAHLALRQGPAICYALTPLCNRLTGGSICVVRYAPGTLAPSEELQVFSNIDLDAWARTFAAALDEILSPGTLAAIAAADAAASEALIQARAVVAQALAQALVPVFPQQPGLQLAKAQEHFRQSALVSLSGACAASVLVQLPATIVLHGAMPADTAELQFHGQIEVLPAPGASAMADTRTAGGVTLAASGQQPGTLHFLVKALQPQQAASLQLALVYRACLAGYWPESPVDLALGTLQVPIPSHTLPPALLLAHQAVQSQAPAEGDASAALRWDYHSTLQQVPQDAQDTLWVNTSFPLPHNGERLRAGPARGSTARLFEALGAFIVAWPQLQAYLAGPARPLPAALVAALLHHVGGVADAWGALRSVTGNTGAPPDGSYLFDFAHAHDQQQLLVHARADSSGNILWPVINGQHHGAVLPSGDLSPDDSGSWLQSGYPYEAGAGALRITWPGLDLATHLSATSGYRSVRNAHLPVDDHAHGKVHPALVYQNMTAFAAPVMPLLTLPPQTHAGATSLIAAFGSALQICTRAASVPGVPWSLKLQLSYRYQADATGLPVQLPVLLLPDLVLTRPGSDVPAATALQQLAGQLAVEVQRWHDAMLPDTSQAALLLDLTMFIEVDGAPRPVVQAPDIAITVPAGWWPVA